MVNFGKIKKRIFIILAAINKKILPKYSNKDLNKLSKLDKVIIGYRYYITKNAIDKER